MTIVVEAGDPRHPQAAALLRSSHELMAALFPAEDNHYLSVDALCASDIHFFVARIGQDIVGTGALANRGAYGEIKSMFVAQTARGRGVGDAILARLEKCARQIGLNALMLETGSSLADAHRLYRRHGFTKRGPFGDYRANSTSIFMEKSLS